MAFGDDHQRADHRKGDADQPAQRQRFAVDQRRTEGNGDRVQGDDQRGARRTDQGQAVEEKQVVGKYPGQAERADRQPLPRVELRQPPLGLPDRQQQACRGDRKTEKRRRNRVRVAGQETPGDKGPTPEKGHGKEFQVGFQAGPRQEFLGSLSLFPAAGKTDP